MTSVFIKNVPDLKECNNVSYYNFLKTALPTKLTKIQNPIYFDENPLREKIESLEIPEIGGLKDDDSDYFVDKDINEFLINDDIYNLDNDTNYYLENEESVKLVSNELNNLEECEIHDSSDQRTNNENEIKELRPISLIFSQIKFFNKYTNLVFEQNRESTLKVDLYIPYFFKPKKEISLTKKGYILIGELPLLTSDGTFIIQETERIVINQLVRSPGIYLKDLDNSLDNPIITIISEKGICTNLKLESQSGEHFANNLCDFSFNVKEFISLFPEKEKKKVLENEKPVINFNLLLNDLQDVFIVGIRGRQQINKIFKMNIPDSEESVTNKDLYHILNNFNKKNEFFFIDEENDLNNYENRYIHTLNNFLEDAITNNISNFLNILSLEFLRLNNVILDAELSKEILEEAFESISDSLFAGSALQFADCINPLSLLSQTRRITVLGPLGVPIEEIPKEMSQIQPEQYGRVCPIETVDGLHAGLISSLALVARINKLGDVEQPYYLYNQTKKLCSSVFLTSVEEKNFFISFFSEHSSSKYIFARKFTTLNRICKNKLNFTLCSPLQMFSLSIALIPFLEHNELGRMQMAASMKKQTLPIIFPQSSLIGTGVEDCAAYSSGFALKTFFEGVTIKASSFVIECLDNYNQKIIYPLLKNIRLNQKTFLSYKPAVWLGEKLFNGQIIAYGPGIKEGELALGYNLNVSYLPWEGYNFEDGIVLSERLILDDCLTSAHIFEYDLSAERLFNDFFTKKVSILTAKKSNLEVFEKIFEFRYFYHTVTEEVTEENENSDKIETDVQQPDNLKWNFIRFYTIKLKKIQIGDKLSGRYGNKGIVTKIVPIVDMPYTNDGTKVDLILNPLGIPSRMNLGQLFESFLAVAGSKLSLKHKVLSFNEFWKKDMSTLLLNQSLKDLIKVTNINWFSKAKNFGKIYLKDAQSGNFFDNTVVVGKNYIFKLIHLVSEKYQTRKNEKYLQIFNQPTVGKQQKGGQRFGEMETWALEAYGSFFSLQEFLTTKADSFNSRNKMLKFFKFFKKFDPLSYADLPMSLIIFLREMNSIGLSLDLIKFKI